MGIKTVAVYSDADATRCMWKWPTRRCISARRRPAESYIVIDKIMEAMQADRRGGGASGLRLPVGEPEIRRGAGKGAASPSSARRRRIEAMGDKITSKKIAAEAGVNTCRATWA
jgi:propionyl-CoA carboxylase alpha chain